MRILRLSLAFLILGLTLQGCGIWPTAPVLSLLTSGKSVLGYGVLLGAPKGALTTPVQVSIGLARNPLFSSPLPEGMSAAGRFYDLHASPNVVPSLDLPLVIGIPVPEGVDPDKLILGFLITTRTGHHGSRKETPTWFFESGFYDEDAGMFLAPIQYIGERTQIVSLINTELSFPRRIGSLSAQQVSTDRGIGITEHFYVYCGFRFGKEEEGECTDSEAQTVANNMETAYGHFQALGFDEPWLAKLEDLIDVRLHVNDPASPGEVIVIASRQYKVVITPDDASLCEKNRTQLSSPLGIYEELLKRIQICMDRLLVQERETALLPEVSKHELFHAIQMAEGIPEACESIPACPYLYLDKYVDGEDAFIEGTATAAMSSLNTALNASVYRFPDNKEIAEQYPLIAGYWNLRPLDAALFTGDDEYLTQDFWVYLGRRLNLQIDYLIPIFQEGFSVEDIDEVLRNESTYPENLSLGDFYWDYVKNQTFEKGFSMDLDPAQNQRLGDSCVLNSLFENPLPDVIIVSGTTLPGTNSQFQQLNDVASLSARLIKLIFPSRPAASYAVKVTVMSNRGNLASKFYEDFGFPNDYCLYEPDLGTKLIQIHAGAGDVSVYLLVANTELSRDSNVTIEIEELSAQTYVVNSSDDIDDGTCDSNHCSLREAINISNQILAKDTIEFNIPGPGVHTIQPTRSLPTISDPVVIDGYTQPGASEATSYTPASLMIELDGTNAATLLDAIRISAGDSVIRGLAINRFQGAAIKISAKGGNIIQGNYLGTDITGTIDLGNTGSGVFINNPPNNLVGGANPADRNIIAGNQNHGVTISGTGASGNEVLGNYIGVGADGITIIGNSVAGILISNANGNIIGGSPAARNLISGNALGIWIDGVGAPVSGNSVSFNNISGNQGLVSGRGMTNSTSQHFIAENNWWGCATGPGTTGCDSITGDVDFSPYSNVPF